MSSMIILYFVLSKLYTLYSKLTKKSLDSNLQLKVVDFLEGKIDG